MPPTDPVALLTDPASSNPTILAVGLLTAELRTNSSAMVELGKRIEKLETVLGGEAAELGMKTNVALLQQKIKTMEAKEHENDQWKRNFKTNLYVAILVWLLSIIYNVLSSLHKTP